LRRNARGISAANMAKIPEPYAEINGQKIAEGLKGDYRRAELTPFSALLK
jgi:hypothetical protein